MSSRSTCLSAVVVSTIIAATLAQTPRAGASGGSVPGTNGSVPNQAQPTAAPNNQVNPQDPRATNPPNNANLANGGAVAAPNQAAPNQNVNGTGVVTDPNQLNNATALTGSGVLNSLGGTGTLSGDMLARLQNEAINRKMVTLTGRIMDVQTFFLGGILGIATPAIVGQPISPANGNLNAAAAANGTVPNAPGAGVGAGTNTPPTNQPRVTVRQNGIPNLAVQNQNQTITPPPPGNIPNLAQSGTNNVGASNSNAMPNSTAVPISGFGQFMVLQTNNGALLLAQDPLAAAMVTLSATAMPVTVQGRIYERNGIRLMLVSALNVPGAFGAGNNNSSGSGINNSGTTNNPTGVNKSRSGTIRSTR